MLGEVLRKARENQNLTIEDLERETSIRKAYIAAIEEEDFDALPSDVYIKGFIRNLSRFLHTDGDALISEFIDMRKAKISEEKGEVPPKIEENDITNNIKSENISLSIAQRRSKKVNKSNFFVAALLILALIGAGAFYFMNKNEVALPSLNLSSNEKTDDAKNEKNKQIEKTQNTEKKTETPVKTESPKVEQPKETQNTQPAQNTPSVASQNAATPESAPTKGVEVIAGLEGNCWVRVTVDGNVVFEDIAADGSVHTWKGNDKIEIIAGNAGAMNITHNGKNVGAMGEYGQVAEKVFTK
ncbi:MAG: helix-turn-helix domain-containing protein [Selenomonadaceae bacterium]|nr:helix-turn-helix domain-containing protein [Selenomonadaceae bacterium]